MNEKDMTRWRNKIKEIEYKTSSEYLSQLIREIDNGEWGFFPGGALRELADHIKVVLSVSSRS